jgi:hypothetical protein
MRRMYAVAAAAYVAGTVAVLSGLLIGHLWVPRFSPRPPLRLLGEFPGILNPLTSWDAQWYLAIAERGYWHVRGQPSAVAFFPAYPLLIRCGVWLTPLPSHWVALVASNVFLVLALLMLGVYLRGSGKGAMGSACYAMFAAALFPTGFFMRMPYSESLFLLLCLMLFLGMRCKWPIGVLAALAGVITATRPVGVVATLPLAVHVWHESTSWRHAVVRLALAAPLAVWGLLAFIAYQWAVFGEPLAFFKTQHFWRMRPSLPAWQMAVALASWEPIWSVYTPGLPGYWKSVDPGLPLVLSYQSMNCILFVGAMVLLAAGRLKGWLTWHETLFGVAHLVFTYTLAGYRFAMLSQGRFVSVVFPIYIVLGQLLARLPWPAAAAVLLVSTFYLGTFSALLAAGYLMI